MADVLREEREGVFRDGGERLSVVDVDVHEMLTSIRDLIPYLEEPWRSRIEVNDGFKGPPGNPYAFPQPTGVAIQDAVTDDGSPAGSKLEMVQEQVLDRYDIEPAILNSLFHPTDHQIQPEFATALASAYNDWIVENWLDREERLRSSITVAAQEPHDAAREIDRAGSDPRFVQVILPAVAHHVFGKPTTGRSSRPPNATTSSSLSTRAAERGRRWGCPPTTSSGTRPSARTGRASS
ncbi:hypothetical protein BH18ACT10_BH18ACT10_11910 [soil metagenome]